MKKCFGRLGGTHRPLGVVGRNFGVLRLWCVLVRRQRAAVTIQLGDSSR